ncbi:MAG: hypothetical protein MUF06_08405 [Pirellulaceae bacterium]|nr:hypothetical protein [Pirellulaceae bacterium]
MCRTQRWQRRGILAAAAAAIAVLYGTMPLAKAQQVTVGTPFNTAGSSYYEQFGVQWGLRGNGWFARFGGPVAPPFGGFDPNAGASFGFGGRNGFLNFSAGQGSSTTFGSQTPILTLPSGGTGFFADQTMRPFVTGIVPVVGDGPPVVPFRSVLDERLSRLSVGQRSAGQPATLASAASVATATDAATSASAVPAVSASAAGPSTAERGDLSIAEIEASRAHEQAAREAAELAKIDELVASGEAALAAGKAAAARIYWQQAARRAVGEQRARILKRIESAK